MLLSGALYVLGAIISFAPLVFFAITIKYYMDLSKDPNAKPLIGGLPKNKTSLIVIAITLLILQVVIFSQLAFIFRILI